MNQSRDLSLVLAVHPTSNGFGWVLFEGPNALVVWGIASAKDKRNATSMRRFETLLNQYQPSVLVLEQFEEGKARRGGRIQDLSRTMRGFAANRNIEVLVYSREEVGLQITGDAGSKRHAVARVVVKHFPLFRRRMPREREVWQSEDTRQCLFDAAALAMTHFAISRSDD
jgi:Holliday junction resolvasome RuvABC endonuclease subunit